MKHTYSKSLLALGALTIVSATGALGACSVYAAKTPAQQAGFEDEAFYSCVLAAVGAEAGAVLTDAQLAAITSLNCAEKNIQSAEGIEKLTKLEDLNLDNNKLEELDVFNNDELKKLSANGNTIDYLDLSTNDKLEELHARQDAAIDIAVPSSLLKIDVKSSDGNLAAIVANIKSTKAGDSYVLDLSTLKFLNPSDIIASEYDEYAVDSTNAKITVNNSATHSEYIGVLAQNDISYIIGIGFVDTIHYWLDGEDGEAFAWDHCFSPYGLVGCEVTVGEETPTRDGYTFIGWAQALDATKADFKPGDTVKLPLGEGGVTDLYAVWQKSATQQTGATKTNTAENPNTSDNSLGAFVASLVLGSIVGAGLVLTKRRR